jgi:glycine/D-amino acid oxidase-like deaminating enzyme
VSGHDAGPTAAPRAADIVVIGGGVARASLAYHRARKKAGRVVRV